MQSIVEVELSEFARHSLVRFTLLVNIWLMNYLYLTRWSSMALTRWSESTRGCCLYIRSNSLTIWNVRFVWLMKYCTRTRVCVYCLYDITLKGKYFEDNSVLLTSLPNSFLKLMNSSKAGSVYTYCSLIDSKMYEHLFIYILYSTSWENYSFYGAKNK